MDRELESTVVGQELAGETVLAGLRRLAPSLSWSRLRERLARRQVLVNGILCLEEARRLREGDVLALRRSPAPPPPGAESVRIVFRDEDLLVIDKPSGMLTERRPEEARWPAWRKAQRPTAEEVVRELLMPPNHQRWKRQPDVRLVHRLDRDTSGLLAIALNSAAEAALIDQFRKHTARRTYLAVVPGHPDSQTIESRIVRDRGDGLRGSTAQGQLAVTHITVVERIREFSLLRCDLETGRTNQIRIHLAELGHPVCGDTKYRGPLNSPIADTSRAPRLALHASRLALRHPVAGEHLAWDAAWPSDLSSWLAGLRATLTPPQRP